MIPTTYLSVMAAISSLTAAQDAFYMCTENKCEKCPASVSNTGGPGDACVVYNSEDTFANQGFSGTEGGGYQVYFDVEAAEPGCATVIRTPAGTDLPGCGVVIASFKQPACVAIALEKTFMVQSCCGDACDDLGSKRIRGVGPLGARSLALRGLGGYLLKDADGNVIEPAEIGAPPPEEKRARDLAAPAKLLSKRDCEKDSWQGGDVLTKPANNVQIVSDSVVGPGQVTVTKGRSQSWSTSISGGLSFADIFNMGVSADMTEEESSSKSVTVSIPEGQSGKLGFTATLSCRSGSGRCNGGEVEGEVCWPTKNGDGDVAGTYRVIVET